MLLKVKGSIPKAQQRFLVDEVCSVTGGSWECIFRAVKVATEGTDEPSVPGLQF